MPPQVRTGKRLGVNIRDHFLGISILELEDVVVGNIAQVLKEELDAYAMRSAQVSHSWVFACLYNLDTRRVVFMEDTRVAGG